LITLKTNSQMKIPETCVGESMTLIWWSYQHGTNIRGLEL